MTTTHMFPLFWILLLGRALLQMLAECAGYRPLSLVQAWELIGTDDRVEALNLWVISFSPWVGRFTLVTQSCGLKELRSMFGRTSLLNWEDVLGDYYFLTNCVKLKPQKIKWRLLQFRLTAKWKPDLVATTAMGDKTGNMKFFTFGIKFKCFNCENMRKFI